MPVWFWAAFKRFLLNRWGTSRWLTTRNVSRSISLCPNGHRRQTDLQAPWAQSFIWRHCGAAVRWVIRNFVFNWAKPIPATVQQPASVLPEISLSTASAERSTVEQRPNTVVHPEQPVPKPHLRQVTGQSDAATRDRLSETR